MKLPAASGGDFAKCPAGNHVARCYEILDIGTQETNFGEKHQVRIAWETPLELMEDGQPFIIGQRFTWSMNEKANLRNVLESWRGKPFTDDQLGDTGTFAFESIIGAPCLLNVVHVERDGKEYANIEAVTPLPKGTKAPPMHNSPRFVALNADEFDPDAFATLTERMQEIIAASPEFKELTNSKPRKVTMPDVPEGDSGKDGDDDESPF